MRNFTPYVKEYLLMAAVVAVAWTAALAFALVVNATILSATDEREIRALSSTSIERTEVTHDEDSSSLWSSFEIDTGRLAMSNE